MSMLLSNLIWEDKNMQNWEKIVKPWKYFIHIATQVYRFPERSETENAF